jgi:ADP-heptose:LPS heptosyltransferase
LKKKFLIIRFSSIGDIVLTSPIARCIKKENSKYEVHYLTKYKFSELVTTNPHVDKVYTIQKNTSEIIQELKAEKYDAVFDLHNNIRSRLVTNALHAKTFRFNKLNFKKWLLVNTKINKLPSVHIVDRYLETIEKYGIKMDDEGLDFFIPPTTKINVDLKLNNQYIALVIGGTHFTKKFPTDKIIELCNKLTQQVVLIGGKTEVDDAKNIISKTKGNVVDCCGKFSLLESAILIKNADVVISNDTGFMHIAAAFNKKIISLWGNTVPEFGMYPYLKDQSKNCMVQVQNLSCRPCSKIGFSTCPKKHFNCMNDINNQEIIDHLNEN